MTGEEWLEAAMGGVLTREEVMLEATKLVRDLPTETDLSVSEESILRAMSVIYSPLTLRARLLDRKSASTTRS